MTHPHPTKYLEDFLEYYKRAKILEDRNHRSGKRKSSGCPLQDNVSIYDTIRRRYAGFSNVLRDLHSGIIPVSGDGKVVGNVDSKKWSLATWLYVYGVHRMTGSGASFYPKSQGWKRHGYMNTPMFDLALNAKGCKDPVAAMYTRLFRRIEEEKIPTWTSMGNQPPPFPSPGQGYTKGGAFYLCEIWPNFAREIAEVLESSDRADLPSIASLTDWVLQRNVERGFKQFKFTMTAFVMDIADWHPQFVSPLTQCYYGANCFVALNAMFSGDNRTKGKKFYHEAMDLLCGLVEPILGEQPAPMDVEDCACDIVRYWNRFVPKHGYEKLAPDQRTPISKISYKEFQAFQATM